MSVKRYDTWADSYGNYGESECKDGKYVLAADYDKVVSVCRGMAAFMKRYQVAIYDNNESLSVWNGRLKDQVATALALVGDGGGEAPQAELKQ